jgi:hypothetical protein
VFALKGIISSSPLQASIEARLRTGQAAGLSNGVNIFSDLTVIPKQDTKNEVILASAKLRVDQQIQNDDEPFISNSLILILVDIIQVNQLTTYSDRV